MTRPNFDLSRYSEKYKAPSEAPVLFLERKLRIMTSLAIFLCFTTSIAIIALTIIHQLYVFTTFNIVLFGLLIATAILQFRKKHIIARLILLYAVLAYLFTSTIMLGTDNLGHGNTLLIFPFIVATTFLFRNQHKSHKKLLLVGTFIYLIFWFFFDSFFNSYYQLTPAQSKSFLNLIFGSGIINCLVGCFIIIRINQRATQATSKIIQEKQQLNAAIPDFVVRINKNGLFTRVSHQLNTLPHDFHIQEGIHIEASDLPHPVQLNWKNALEQCLISDAIQRFEYHIDLEDGTHFFESCLVKNDQDSAMVFIRDISKRKREEKRTQEVKKFFEQILGEINLEIVVFDTDFKYKFVSKHTVKDPELRDWMIGKSNFDYCKRKNLPSRLAETRHKRLKQAKESKKAIIFSENMYNKNSRMLVHRKRIIAPVLDDNDNVKHLIGYGFDITDLKDKEAQLEIQNKQLKKLNSELDRFVYSVSHDLRSPIASCLGIIELAKSENNIEQLKEYLEMQEQSLSRLDSFIEDILNYSRNNRTDLKTEYIDLEDLFLDILAQHSMKKEYRNIQADITINTENGNEFKSDRNRLTVILGNLISNAFRYHNHQIPNSYIKIKGEISSTMTTITIEDNGIGINEKHLPNIFNMFYRANDQIKGSGLGLYLVKETTEKLQGNINVESVYGQGTKFILNLPSLK